MSDTELLTPVLDRASHHAVPAAASDADFASRWTAWVERGRVHEQRVRRRFVVWAGVLTLGAAITYAFLRS